MTAQQWADWLEYARVEPWGFAGDDIRHGLLCATFLTPHAKLGHRPDPHAFMLRPPPERELAAKEMEAVLDTLLGVRPAKPEEPAAT